MELARIPLAIPCHAVAAHCSGQTTMRNKKKSWENEDRTFPSPLLWSRKTAKHKILDLEWTRANMNLHSDYTVDALV